MEYIKGEDRGQGTFLPERLEDYIAEDNPVRVIDAYVDSIDMEAHGFEKSRPNDTGRPMYAPQDLLKLYLYGYSNQVFSTRKLEAETKRNLEVIWLMKKLSPDHKTIARFRQRNAEALKSVFRHFTKLCIDMGLYGKKLIAIDGSKFKANNSRERNYTEKKLADRIARIDAKIESYMAELEAEESEQIEEHSKEEITEAVKKLRERKQGYRELQQKMAEQELRQISVTDPDSRLMKTSNGMDVCYNIQTAVDSQNKMIAEFEVTSEANDINQLCPLTEKAAEILEKPALSVTADAGYDNAGSIADLIGKGHTVNVAGADYDICIPCPKEASEEITGHEESRCVYIAERNIFICPMGNVLYPSSYHKSNRSARYRNKRACKGCQCKCTAELYKTAERHCKLSEFSKEYNDSELYVRQIKVRSDKSVVKQRKSIIEHIFGTVKRSLGISCLVLRGRDKVTGEISLAFTAYNMKRAINILGVQRMIQYLKALYHILPCSKMYYCAALI